MRRTLFVFPLDLAAVVHAACTESIAAAQRRRYAKEIEKGGIAKNGARWLARAETATMKALEARGEAFATDLSSDVPQLRRKIHYGEGKTWAGSTSMTSWVLFLLAADGRIVRGRPRGAWTSSQWSWVPAQSWLSAPLARLDPEPARAELARRWLTAYGPGTVLDLKWWTRLVADPDAGGAGRGRCRRGRSRRCPRRHPSRRRPDASASSRPWAALLPALDPTVMGWKERDWYLGEHRPALFDTAGNAGPTVWWSGRIVGGWAARKGGEIALRLLEDIGREGVSAVEAEAERLEAWLAERTFAPLHDAPRARAHQLAVCDDSPRGHQAQRLAGTTSRSRSGRSGQGRRDSAARSTKGSSSPYRASSAVRACTRSRPRTCFVS